MLIFALINPYCGLISKRKKQIAGRDCPLQNGCTTPKMTTKVIPRVLVVRMATKVTIVDKNTVENEDSFEGEGVEESGAEVTDMQIQDFGNESIGETEENLNRRLLGNHKDFNKGFSI